MPSQKLPVGLFADPFCKEHDSGVGHPESPARFNAVLQGLEEAGLLKRFVRMEPRKVQRENLLLVHTAKYLETAESEINSGIDQLSTGDTNVGPHSWEVALRAAGSALAAVDAVLTDKISRAFCVVRPPGHHATPDRGMGFCVLNNVALAARHAQKQHGITRVLIVDWDVHHGNGTQDCFYSDGSVFFFSTHQWPWYPGTGSAAETGAGEGLSTTLNCPLPAGSGHAEIFEAFEKKLLPAADAFRPELVLISAGFDSRVDDPLGRFTLSDSDFADLTRIVRDIAARHAQGRVVSVLEGGYNLPGLASAAAAHASAMIE
ncbi:histone deacetylase family protein [Verrucomicrobiota bacterium sgz303538]